MTFESMAVRSDKPSGPYIPTLIIHGGAGAITRAHLPPDLYKQYESSLLKYVTETRSLLYDGANALTAAIHAVSLMEDDPLFNCGRGSVFTEKGTIEMEASVMVASVRPDAAASSIKANGGIPAEAFQKRGAGVMLVTETKHPIRLAEQVLLHTQKGNGSGSMHCQLSGPDLEETGFREWGMERMDKDWFWTKRRWDEHLRGLEEGSRADFEPPSGGEIQNDVYALPSQGTVGCVCMDQWGNVVVATSTGGLTNKKAGRIGDTPTLGAGFWAESWEELKDHSPQSDGLELFSTLSSRLTLRHELYRTIQADLRNITSCIPWAGKIFGTNPRHANSYEQVPENRELEKAGVSRQPMTLPHRAIQGPGRSHRPQVRRRAVALSGTGNGDSFLRVCAGRTVGARCRFTGLPLRHSLSGVAGANGELQQSADDRWGSGEGEGGMIGIEVIGSSLGKFDSTQDNLDQDGYMVQPGETQKKLKGEIVWDFNCGGLWRAFWDEAKDKPKVMVFKKDYDD